MSSNKSILALITARGGSKGIPCKNIKILSGKPLIAWTIEAAIQSCAFSKIIVSTNDVHIADISDKYGAEVPFIRPDRLAQDSSPHLPVILHALQWLIKKQNYNPDCIMLLQPTSPLRISDDINEAIKLLKHNNADSIISICEAITHPYLLKIIENRRLIDFIKTPKGYLRRQNFPKVYQLNGSIYLIKTEIVLREKTLLPLNTFPYKMKIERSIDIDTEFDFMIAEYIMQNSLHLN